MVVDGKMVKISVYEDGGGGVGSVAVLLVESSLASLLSQSGWNMEHTQALISTGLCASHKQTVTVFLLFLYCPNGAHFAAPIPSLQSLSFLSLLVSNTTRHLVHPCALHFILTQG